ncbi:MAG: DsbA family oxidoreductase [Bacteroidia bacterium]
MQTKIVLFISIIALLSACSEPSKSQTKPINASQTTTPQTENKMTVEIWSDMMCPFCYIGKRHFEQALSHFADSNKINIVWKSYQLDPSIPEHFEKPVNIYEYLAQRKGISVSESKQMHQQVVEMAKKAGLNYNFDIAVVANSFKAHRLLQYAKTKGLSNAVEECLFKGYFTEGKDFSNENTLIELVKPIGLTETDVKEALNNEVYATKVKQDIAEAEKMGVNGVPFFVFNGKQTISGAQPSSVFAETLNKSLADWQKETKKQ